MMYAWSWYNASDARVQRWCAFSCRYWIQASVDRALGNLIRLRRLNVGACAAGWQSARIIPVQQCALHMRPPWSILLNSPPGSLACALPRCCAGDKLRICGAELESHAAGSPLHACNTARLKLCRNNTFRCNCSSDVALLSTAG